MFDKRFITLVVLIRLVGLFLPYRWSDDPYRYWWEGRVQNAGHNPYQYAPAAPELEHLRDAHWQQVAHKEVPTVYGPLLLGVFRLAALTDIGPVIFKWIFTIFDLAICALLAHWLGKRALWWALSPLVICEFAWSGHEMSLAIFLFLVGLWRFTTVPWQGAVAFALAILTHLFALPLVLAVAVAGRMRDRRFWGALMGVVVLGYLPFAGAHLLGGLTHFAGRWRFNGSLFEILVRLCGEQTPRELAGDVWLSFSRAKLMAAAFVGLVFVWTWWRHYAPARAALAVAAAILLFSPVVHPWYITWLVALGCLEFRWSWLLWSVTVLLAYLDVSRWWEYGPVFALLIWELSRG